MSLRACVCVFVFETPHLLVGASFTMFSSSIHGFIIIFLHLNHWFNCSLHSTYGIIIGQFYHFQKNTQFEHH